MNQIIAELTDQAGKLSTQPKLSPRQRALKYSLPIVFAIILAIPAITYFIVNRAGSTLFGPDVSAEIRFYTLFRLFGLYAFTFLWGQLMIGPFMTPLGKLYGRNWVYFHRMQGLFALLMAMLHPLIFYVAYIIWRQDSNWFRAITAYTPNVVWVILGETALALMILTVSTALLMRRPALRKRWHWIHLLNYVVFALAWVHSFMLGSEAHSFPMSWLYPFFGVTFIAALAYRRIYRPAVKTDTL